MDTVTIKGKKVYFDPEDREKVFSRTWYIAQNGYVVSDQISRCSMHRLVMGLPKTNIDHADGNKLNNRKSNLRPCDQSKNMANSGIWRTNKSGFRGVSFDKRSGKWVCMIYKNYKHIYLGSDIDKIKLAKLYNQKAKELFGEFAYQNKV